LSYPDSVDSTGLNLSLESNTVQFEIVTISKCHFAGQLMAHSVTDQNALHSIAFKKERFRSVSSIKPG
jgi:hypothetical protein